MKKVKLSSRVRKAFQGRSQGFTLIEVLIAITIVGVISVAFLGALFTASSALIVADKRVTAESLARSQMEYTKNQGYNSTLVNGQATYPTIPGIPDGYSIWSYNRTGGIVPSVIGVPWSSNTSQPYEPPSQDNGLQRIKLVIKYDGNEVITLEGYKRNPGG